MERPISANTGRHMHRKSSVEDIFFQMDSKSFELNKDLSPLSPEVPQLDQKINEQRFENEILKDGEEVLTLTCLVDNIIQFDFQDDYTLLIKEGNKDLRITDQDLRRLERLSKKLAHYNRLNKQEEPESYWRWAYQKAVDYFTPVKKKAKHMVINKVTVRFLECQELGVEGFQYLTDLLKSFENITHLEFEIKNSNQADHHIALVSSLMKSLKHLTYFYVDFSGCAVSDEGLFFLANSIKSHAMLEEIWLRFAWCPNDGITNEGLQTIGKSLESCQKLKVLLLEFNGQTTISSKGLSTVLSALKEKDIEKLYLYFEHSQVNDNFLTFVGETLPHFGRLEVFGLNLTNSNFVTLKGVEKLKAGLESAKRLSTGLYLYLGGCLGVLEAEKMKVALDALIEKNKVKSFVIELE